MYMTTRRRLPQPTPKVSSGTAHNIPGGPSANRLHPASPSYPPNGTYGPPQQYFPAHQSMPAPRYDSVVGGYVDGPSTPASHVNEHKTPWSRNLIGSVAASAFCLNDTKKQEGIWFVLQDLSVRLEGKYK